MFKIKNFYVLNWDFNRNRLEKYDVIPYLVDCYKNTKKNRPTNDKEFEEFVIRNSSYQWWSRCEYEIIISDWPNNKNSIKYDIHKQILMNLDIVTNILMDIVINKI